MDISHADGRRLQILRLGYSSGGTMARLVRLMTRRNGLALGGGVGDPRRARFQRLSQRRAGVISYAGISDLAAWDYASYGVDLIKEEGMWRIWHMVVYTDFVTPLAVSWTEKVSEFLSGTANVEAMVKTVDPLLYRKRKHSHETAPATPA